MEELTQKAYPLVKEMTKVTKAFMNGFSQRKREKGLLDFNDLEHFALQILTKKPMIHGCLAKPPIIIASNSKKSWWMSIKMSISYKKPFFTGCVNQMKQTVTCLW